MATIDRQTGKISTTLSNEFIKELLGCLISPYGNDQMELKLQYIENALTSWEELQVRENEIIKKSILEAFEKEFSDEIKTHRLTGRN